jgi:uncharacterized DUF497 family protein
MNVSYTLHEVLFEWDTRKAAVNLRKHEVGFELACEGSSTRSFVTSTMKLSAVNFVNESSG